LNGGKKVIEHYQSIACKLFVEVEGPKWGNTDDDVKLLGESVKNRVTAYAFSCGVLFNCLYVYRMKKAYIKHRANMSETGQGLLDAGQEDEIIPGSEIANVWRKSSHHSYYLLPSVYLSIEKVQKQFPWYMRLHSLMGTSPVVSKSALAHSRTLVDLSLLDRGGQVF
jgi:hypothetical protein